MAYGTKHQTVDGVKLMGSNLFGTCSTGSSAVNKTVTLDGFDVLVTGVTIHVKFTYGDTGYSRKLIVGSTSAVEVRRNGSSYVRWESGAVVSFTYDGTYWQQNDFYDTDTDTDTDTNTTYTLSGSGDTVTLTGSDGTTSTATVAVEGGEYTLSRSGRTVSLKKGETVVNSVTLPKPTVKKFKKNITLAADNGIFTGTIETGVTLNFNPIGIVGYELTNQDNYSGVSTVNLFSCTLNGEGNIYVQLRNRNSSAAHVTLTVLVLYVPE